MSTGTLLDNQDFITDVLNNVTSPELKLKYAEGLSLRRIQELAKEVRSIAKEAAITEPFPIPSFDVPTRKKFEFPVSPVKSATEWPVLHGDIGLISDLHIPYHDSRILEEFCENCYNLRITQCCIVGDFLDGNQMHPTRGSQYHWRRYQDDVELGERILSTMLDCFDFIEVLQGNHDDWFMDKMRKQVDTTWLMSRIYNKFGGKLHWSGYQQCSAYSGGKEFRLIHGTKCYGGDNPLSTPQGFANKFECGVVTGHTHKSASGWSVSGKHQCVALGGAYDSTKMEYLHQIPMKTGQMTRSYGILKEGYVKLYEQGK